MTDRGGITTFIEDRRVASDRVLAWEERRLGIVFRRLATGLGARAMAELLPRASLEDVLRAPIAEQRETLATVKARLGHAGTYALLRGGGAGNRAGFQPCEHVLEGDHTGVHEHQRRIILRHERRRRHHRVARAFEMIQEGLADVGCRSHLVCPINAGAPGLAPLGVCGVCVQVRCTFAGHLKAAFRPPDFSSRERLPLGAAPRESPAGMRAEP